MREPALTGLVRIAPINRNYLFPRLFPFEDTSTDEFLTWVELDENPLAPFVSVDGETPKMSGDIYSRLSASVAYIRYKRVFKSSDLRIFDEIARSQNSEIARMQFERRQQILKAVNKLNQAVDARLEWLAINALRGSITVDDGGVKISVKYPGPFIGTNQRVASTYWDQSTAKPITDLLKWIEEVGDHCGEDPKVMVCSRRVLREIADLTEVQNLWVTGQFGAAQTSLPPQFVIQSIKMTGLTEVIVYDAKYTTRTYNTSTGKVTRKTYRFLPNNLVLLLPQGAVGSMKTAPGPDGLRTGKFTWNKETIDPWTVETGVGIYAFPAIEDLNRWAVCKVFASAT
jgi:hypothetical protein